MTGTRLPNVTPIGSNYMPKKIRKTRGASSKAIAQDYRKRASSEREAGGSCEIDNSLPSVSIKLSDGSEFYFQEWRADKFLTEAKTTMRDTGLEGLLPIEDFILATS